ncbi:ABC transporter ATP-binding protein [Stella sp.]|uniref:ABC transporter ATP-binding protein n=1 Tax=Stella sp. TaxID=2912054 RepID=UPI0035AF5F97
MAVHDLVKRFGPVAAVDGVSLSVAPGEFVALLGPSGSGKTTILMAIAGFEYPTSGRVEIGGEDVTWAPANKRNLGMVFQRYTLFPHMTVAENIAFPLKMRGVAKAERERRALAALETVRLGGYGGRRTNQLSGGQQQRIALARAIVYQPRVLLMDEPLSALDKNLREEMQLEIKHLQQQLGVTVVFVTHDQTEAMTMADRVAVLDHGRLQQVGAPRELYETPATPFVAGFIGETNFLAGRAVAAAAPGEIRAVDLDGGGRVGAVAVDRLAAGTALRIAVRPERVRLAPPAGGMAATLVEAIYAGVATTLIADLGSERRVRARLAAGVDERQWAAGEAVDLAWRPEDARAFAADRAG